MGIVFPLSLPPVPAPQQIEIGQLDSIGFIQSPFNMVGEKQDWGGDSWTAHLTWSKIYGRAKAAPLLAIMTALRGQLGTVLIGDPLGVAPRGVGSGAPVVNGAVAIGARQLPLRGMAASIAGWLLAGDYLQLGSGVQTRLYQVLDDAATDGSGNVTLDIWPSIRDGYADGAAVTLENCKGTFQLAANQRGWQEAPTDVYSADLNFVEAL
jgi:hypothetical protein